MTEEERNYKHNLKFWKRTIFIIFILILLITTSTLLITNFEKETTINKTDYDSISETKTIPINISLEDIKWKNTTNISK